jgi:hypothetical protein
VSAEAIRLLLCVLGFITFGYGSGEFEVTADRLGCYRPEDHIDNPKGYPNNARDYYDKLRGPIDEQTELGVDSATGMKNYIANEGANIMTSAQHVRKLLTEAVELGRRFGRDKNKPDKYESLRLLGTALHCLEGRYPLSKVYAQVSAILQRNLKLPRLAPPLPKPKGPPDLHDVVRLVLSIPPANQLRRGRLLRPQQLLRACLD